jgi:outer membrane lipoprotein-sorting protein
MYGRGPNRLIGRANTCLLLATLAAICCGCGGGGAITGHTVVAPTQRPVAKDATREELLDRYNAIVYGTQSLNATVQLKPTAGSKYSGVIDEYHEVKAFLLIARPAQIRVIGQAPVVGTTVFDMASDGTTFRVSIPSKHKFLVGPVAGDRTSSKPIENLRPQHLLDALLWPAIRKEEATYLREFNDESARYYILTVLRGGYQTEVLREIWFDRADLQVARLQAFGPKGVLLSDVHFSDWQPVDGAAARSAPAAAANGPASFPRSIRISRPHDDYQLDLQVTKITLNEEIPADRFKLEQPEGSELVQVGDATENKQP